MLSECRGRRVEFGCIKPTTSSAREVQLCSGFVLSRLSSCSALKLANNSYSLRLMDASSTQQNIRTTVSSLTASPWHCVSTPNQKNHYNGTINYNHWLKPSPMCVMSRMENVIGGQIDTGISEIKPYPSEILEWN